MGPPNRSCAKGNGWNDRAAPLRRETLAQSQERQADSPEQPGDTGDDEHAACEDFDLFPRALPPGRLMSGREPARLVVPAALEIFQPEVVQGPIAQHIVGRLLIHPHTICEKRCRQHSFSRAVRFGHSWPLGFEASKSHSGSPEDGKQFLLEVGEERR
jgi:hypothetical protein